MKKPYIKKVIFCETTWMKYYQGVKDDDKPLNGGSYIDEHGDGGECFNFKPYNHKCYGFVNHRGNNLHIERYGDEYKNSASIDDITVIWVASKDDKSRIVGWYEHAKMFREWQYLIDVEAWGPDVYYDYNFVAHEKGCYLIDEENRDFIIPRASQKGKGRGMGQSQLWYADSDYAQNELIPNVLKYLDSVKSSCKPLGMSKDILELCAVYNGESVEELIDNSWKEYKEGNPINALKMFNLAVSIDDCYLTRYNRSQVYAWFALYDKAIEDLKMALFYDETIDALYYLMYSEMICENMYFAAELGEKIHQRKKEDLHWDVTATKLISLYLGVGDIDKAKELLAECQSDGIVFQGDFVEWAEERIKQFVD